MSEYDYDASEEELPQIPAMGPLPWEEMAATAEKDANGYLPDDVVTARFEWELKQMDILFNHPAIGMEGSAANARFVEMFHALGGTLVDPAAVADLIMVYPPKEYRPS